MASGFLRSREFAFSLAAALLIVGFGAFLVTGPAFGNQWFDGDFGCAAPATTGTPVTLAAAPGNASRTRTLTYAFDPGAGATAFDLCSALGDVRVGPSPDGLVHLTVRLDARHASSDAPLDETLVRATMREADGRATLAAWVERHAPYATGPSARDVVDVDVELLLPPQTAADVKASSEHGLVRLDDVRLGEVRIGSGFGDLLGERIDLAGNLTAHASHGRVAFTLASVQTAALDLRSEFGDVTLTLPQRADIGYDVRGSSGFGDVRVQVGTADTYEATDEQTHVRTAGYAEKPTRVGVRAATEFGDVEVAAV